MTVEESGAIYKHPFLLHISYLHYILTLLCPEFKLAKVRRVQLGKMGIPYLSTHDGRTIRYPDPAIKVNDSVKLDLSTGKITDFIRFDTGEEL